MKIFKIRQKSTGRFLDKRTYKGFKKTGGEWKNEDDIKVILAQSKFNPNDTEIVVYEIKEIETLPIPAHVYEGRKLSHLRSLEWYKKQLEKAIKAEKKHGKDWMRDLEIDKFKSIISKLEEPKSDELY